MSARPTILITDDDDALRAACHLALTGAGYEVVEACSGAEAITLLERRTVHAVVLDIDMPEMDGLQALREIRRRAWTVPVLMMTQAGDVDARVRGLTLGADDYVAKPCDPREFLARLAALLRRAPPPSDEAAIVQIGAVKVDLQRRTASAHGEPVKLSRSDFSLLQLLAAHRGAPVSRERIEAHVWGGVGPQSHALDTHLWRLRRKLGDEQGVYLRNVAGLGYQLL